MKRLFASTLLVFFGIMIFTLWEVRAGTFGLPWKNTGASQAALIGISLRDTQYNFGTISMKRGVVSREFTIKNTRAEPLVVSKIATTCTCMTATLQVHDAVLGPSNASLKKAPVIHAEILPGQSATLSVVFDPRAHGPAGIGKIMRRVLLDYGDKEPLAFRLSAFVTP